VNESLLLRVLLGAVSAASGAALLVYFLAGVPLLAGLSATVGVAVGAWAVLWRYLSSPARVMIARRARVGLIAGAVATVGYDLSRFLLVEATGSTVGPFEAWPIFGELLGAGPRTTTVALAVGLTYHGVNGLGFAVAYTIVLGERGVVAGIAWALVLETLMVTFYPGWLGLKALDEFLSVTILGHIVYGALLGGLASVMIRRDPLARTGMPPPTGTPRISDQGM
jgi:hypothetical protein